jgi:hypothetical protein
MRDPQHIIYRRFTYSPASPERSKLLQIISPEGETMSKAELEHQAERAERLARGPLDKLTIERLLAFAAECRSQAAEQRRRVA